MKYKSDSEFVKLGNKLICNKQIIESKDGNIEMDDIVIRINHNIRDDEISQEICDCILEALNNKYWK